MMVAMPLFSLLCALGVDVARVQLVKTELDRSTLSAARYAATGIADGTCLQKANTLGQHNPANGKAVTFAANDVSIGRWDDATRTFTPAATSPNAVRVIGRATVNASFGGWSGVTTKQVTSKATVRFNVVGFGLIGLDSVTMGGNATASYSSSGTSLAGQGNVGSNGNITLGGSAVINGNTYVGIGKTASGGTITGIKGTLAAPLSYPNGSASPYGPSNNSNGNIPSWALAGGGFALQNNQSVSLPGGHYYFNDFEMSANSSLTFTGPATVYCYGKVEMTGKTYTSGNLANNLKLVMVSNPWNGNPPGNVHIGSTAALYATVYAPQSAVLVDGTGDIYGSVLGKTVTMTGNGKIIYDLTLESKNGTLTLVE